MEPKVKKDNNVEALRSFLRKNAAKSFPIKDHPLGLVDEYFRNLYLDVLCSVAQYKNENPEGALALVERIAVGSGDQLGIQEHVRRSMTLEPKDMEEFIKLCQDNELSEMFFVDGALVTLCDGVPESNRLEYVCEIVNVLGIDKLSIEFLSPIISNVLKQSEIKDLEIPKHMERKVAFKIEDNLKCYISDLLQLSLSGVFAEKGDVAVGDTLTFGRFDGKYIKWKVLCIEDKRLIMISEQILCKRAFHHTTKFDKWENTDIGRWLNGCFYEEVFSKTEKSRIEQRYGRYVSLLSMDDIMENSIDPSCFSKYETEWWMMDGLSVTYDENGELSINGDRLTKEIGICPVICINFKHK